MTEKDAVRALVAAARACLSIRTDGKPTLLYEIGDCQPRASRLAESIAAVDDALCAPAEARAEAQRVRAQAMAEPWRIRAQAVAEAQRVYREAADEAWRVYDEAEAKAKPRDAG